MPVIINDFEVLSDRPEPNGTPDRGAEPAAPSSMRPQEIEQIVRHFAERHARLVAD